MSKRYDLVVIGGGTAGLIASRTAAGLGARVALVEERSPGGDCLYTGCVPSKTLIASAALAQSIRSADRLGLEPAEPRFDFARVVEHVQEVIAAAGEEDTPEFLRSVGVEVVDSRGEFERPGLVVAGGRELRYRAALIATGSVPAMPSLPGLRDVEPLTNETVFDLREQPRRLAVLGGGSIGVELGQAFARLGTEVTIVEVASRVLSREEPEAAELITVVLRDEGVRVDCGFEAERVEPNGRGGLLVSRRDGDSYELPFDRLLVAVGRRPATAGLGVERVGVELDHHGAVRVDDRLKTTGDRIYAAGDVLGGLHFTHVAAYHGLLAVANALFRARRHVDHRTVPWVIFTDPEVARVGLSEDDARRTLGREPLIFRHDYRRLDRALTAGAARGFAKLVAGRRGRLLGATIVGPAAGESVAEVARLVREGARVADVSQAIHAYPTFTEGPARAADDWWRRRYFTPSVRRLLRPLLALGRALDRPRG